jgi:hypothetical protein
MIWYSYEQLRSLAARGKLRRETPIYDSPRRRWLRADAIPEIAPFFPRPRTNPGGVLALALAGLAVAYAAEQYRLRRLSWEELRTAVFERDGYTCTYCGYRGTSRTLEVDHRTPLARGGTDDPSNLATACWRCNREKGTMTEWEYRFSRLGC